MADLQSMGKWLISVPWHKRSLFFLVGMIGLAIAGFVLSDRTDLIVPLTILAISWVTLTVSSTLILDLLKKRPK